MAGRRGGDGGGGDCGEEDGRGCVGMLAHPLLASFSKHLSIRSSYFDSSRSINRNQVATRTAP